MKRILMIMVLCVSVAYAQTPIYKTVTAALDTTNNLFRAGTFTLDLNAKFQKLADGVVTGLVPTASGSNLSITSGTYRLNQITRTASAKTFSNIPLSGSGLQRILVIFGNTSGVLDTLSGAQSTNPVNPILPVNTIRLAFTTVTDGSISPPSPDLSGYPKLSGGNNFIGNQSIGNIGHNGAIANINNFNDLTINGQTGDISSNAITYQSGGGGGAAVVFGRNSGFATNIDFYVNPNLNNVAGALQKAMSIQNSKVVDFVNNPTINGVPIGTGSGTVTSFSKTDNFGILSTVTNPTTTPNHAIAVDTAVVRTVANSLTKSQTQTALNAKESILTFGTGLNRTANAITNIGVTSITGIANQVIASSSTGAVTLSLPQSISPSSTPTFGGLKLSGDGTFVGISYPFKGLELWGSDGYRIGFDNKSGTKGLIRYNIVNGGLTDTWQHVFSTSNDLTPNAFVDLMAISASGNVSIGTTTPTAKLDVNGTGNFSGALTGTSATFSGKLNLSTPTTTTAPLKIPYGVAPTTPVTGDIWRLSTGVRTQTFDGTNTKDFIFDKTNSVFSGSGNVGIIANNVGTLSTAPIVSYLTSGNLIKSSAYTITTTDFGANGTVTVFASGNTTITLPTASLMAGISIRVIKTDTAGTTITLSTGGTITIQNSSVTVVSNGTNRIELL